MMRDNEIEVKIAHFRPQLDQFARQIDPVQRSDCTRETVVHFLRISRKTVIRALSFGSSYAFVTRSVIEGPESVRPTSGETPQWRHSPVGLRRWSCGRW